MIARYVTLLVLLLLTGNANAADATWKIFEIKGKASLQVDNNTKAITNEKNLLEAIPKGSRVKVEGEGKVVVVSLKSRQAFEIGSNSEGVLDDDQVRAVRGTVSVKKGFSLPKGNDGRMGGIVMRGAGNTRSCLKAISPMNTAIVDLAPELRWENNCDGLKQVTITVLADERIVHSAESSDTTFKVPAGVLQPGSRYMWLIDGGANFDMASGVFTILADTERKEVLERTVEYAKEGGDDITGMIAFIYYADGKGLNEITRQESAKVRQRFPGAEGLKELP